MGNTFAPVIQGVAIQDSTLGVAGEILGFDQIATLASSPGAVSATVTVGSIVFMADKFQGSTFIDVVIGNGGIDGVLDSSGNNTTNSVSLGQAFIIALPEPASGALIVSGVLALMAFDRRRRRGLPAALPLRLPLPLPLPLPLRIQISR